MQFKETSREELLIQLYKIGVIKFGSFTLKSGKQSPIYIDMRKVVSHPSVLEALTYVMWEKIQTKPFDLLCGVPYGAVPLTTALSLYSHKPMIMLRKEVKEHGTKQSVEGKFDTGDTVLLVEDVTTTGGSTLRSIHALEQVGLKVPYAVVFLDREQGAGETLFAQGAILDAVCTLDYAVELLFKENQINAEYYTSTKQYLSVQS